MPDDARILAVAARLLADGGLEGMTTDRVAAGAGVSKTTLYRRWPSKTALAVAALEATAPALRPLGGDAAGASAPALLAELTGLLDELAELLTGPTGALYAALVGSAYAAPELPRAWREHVVAPRRAAVLGLLADARAAGTLAPGADETVLVDALVGPLFLRALVLGDPLRPGADVRRHLDQVIGPWLRPGNAGEPREVAERREY